MKNKHFALIVTYETGKCVFLTDEADIIKATEEYKEKQKEIMGYKNESKFFSLPVIQSVEIVRVLY